MPSPGSRTARNPLIRHLQRHTRLATLQRMPDVHERAIFNAESWSPVQNWPVVKAHLWRPLVQDETFVSEETGTAPIQANAPLRTPYKPGQPAQVPANPMARPVETPETDMPQRPQPAIPVRPAIQRTSETAATPRIPPATAPTGRDDEDRNWRRLQAILHRHQEMESQPQTPLAAAEKPAPSSAESQPPGPREPENQTMIVTPTVPAPGNPTPLPGETTPGKPMKVDPLNGPVDVNVTAQGFTSFPAEESVHADLRPATAQKENVPIQKQPAVNQPVQPLPDVVEASTGLEPEYLEEPSQGDDLPPEQPLPLEAVWPVQTIQRSPALHEASAPPALITGQPVREQDIETLRAALDQVAPGKVSESSIELIPPRKPRPVSTQSQPAGKGKHIDHAAPVEQTSDASTAAQIQSETVDRGATGGNQIDSSAENPAPQAAVPTPLQREVLNGPSQPTGEEPHQTPARASDVVDTAIGPLPGDLWKLIGEPVPRQNLAAPPVISSQQSQVSRSEAAPAETSTILQREPEPSQAPPASSASDTAAPGQETGGEIDIDQLAKRVYAEVRRRLSVEWDRMRRR